MLLNYMYKYVQARARTNSYMSFSNALLLYPNIIIALRVIRLQLLTQW